MKTTWSSLVPILRSDAQGRILAAIMVSPDAEQSLADLARRSETTHPTVLREVDRAEAAGIVRSRRVGRARLVRAETEHPLYDALAKVVLATYGPPAIVADTLGAIGGVEELFLFGSWAARYEGRPGRFPNDIDVLVIGQPVRDDVYDAAEHAEHQIGQRVQVTIRTSEQWHDEGTSDPFLLEVRSRPLVKIATREEDE